MENTVENVDLKLMTVKKASEISGLSQSFLRKLLQQRKLKRYKINSATLLNFKEIEKIAQLAMLPDNIMHSKSFQ